MKRNEERPPVFLLEERTSSPLDEADLVRQAKEDPEAFGLLYERYVARVYRYCFYRTGDVQDAEDLTARTFYRMLKHLPRYQERGLPFGAWVYRIAHNVVANWLRDRSRHPVVGLERVGKVPAPEGDLVAHLEDLEEREALMQAIRRLPPDRQTLLYLKFVEEMSNAEIGVILGRSEGAVKSLYHRTLVELRRQLRGEEENGSAGNPGE
ncbi:MAG: sigma-70 family RNA polymerase sigma factor [Thermoflexia bacterium]|nr:MAG: sigma-70 family RNA polymerase sigma factor [Thermoflexia bacterium]